LAQGAGAFGNHVNDELIAMAIENAKLHAQVSRLEAELIKLQTELRELRDNKRTAPILPMRAAQRHASKPSARSPAI
jgi:predicted nuclease with TOPRIM domain